MKSGASRRREGTKPRTRVAIVTGGRSEYGLLRSTIQAVADHPRLKLQLVVTGSHLLRKFGGTIRDIERDGWRIDARIPMQRGDDDPVDQAIGLSRGVAGIAGFLDRARTDIVVVLGDRVEAMAGALAAVTSGRFVAHIHGGDVAPGDFDDSLRHAITKLSHLHLAASESARRRITQMGESSDRVHVVGAPGLDRIRELRASKSKSRGSRKSALIVQHPCGRTATVERRTMTNILDSVESLALDAICIHPNSDRGHSGIVAAIEVHRRRTPPVRFRYVRSLDRDAFLAELIAADVLVGNSSSGMIEAAAAGTWAVNIGDRQRGRDFPRGCVINSSESASAIRAAIHKALGMPPVMGQLLPRHRQSTGARIAELIAAMPLMEPFRRKVFADLRPH
jgi:UDP-hydrolysing UDP-N-acetyl-D-glucosamine 2-epimerase